MTPSAAVAAHPSIAHDVLPFGFLDATHPFAPAVEEFRATLAADADAPAWLADPATVVHAELKGARGQDGGFALDRLYCSVQRRHAGFEALSLCFAAKHGRTDWYAFPDEPYLTSLRAFLRSGALAGRDGVAELDVLRYVPLRRFTFRAELAARPGRPVIGKFKRRSRVHLAHHRAVAIARAVREARAPFAVAAPLGVDDRHGVCYQGVVPGRPLSDLLAGGHLHDGLADAAGVQRAFHGLQARDLPVWDRDAVLREMARDIDWIGFIVPDAEPALEVARRALALAPAPVAPEDLVTCHGDFVCSHVYRDGGDWAVIDLDLAHRAEPLWEVGMALAALTRDVPAVAALRSHSATALTRAEDAYVAGYRAAGGAVDARRLAFWRLRGELYELGLMLTKDHYDELGFARSLALVRELAERVVAEGAS